MNLLGKILTGLICVMSILFLAFALAVYATHREWDELVNNPPGSTPVGLKTQLANALEEGNQLKEDLDELKTSSKPEVSTKTEESDDSDISIENLKEEEVKENTDIKEDTEATNS